jgi:putative intracellular protease/amidase
MKKVAMFIAFNGFRDEEYIEPKNILESAGIRVAAVSTARGKARGKLSATADVDKIIEEINVPDYDALTLVGGPGSGGAFKAGRRSMTGGANPVLHPAGKGRRFSGRIIVRNG